MDEWGMRRGVGKVRGGDGERTRTLAASRVSRLTLRIEKRVTCSFLPPSTAAAPSGRPRSAGSAARRAASLAGARPRPRVFGHGMRLSASERRSGSDSGFAKSRRAASSSLSLSSKRVTCLVPSHWLHCACTAASHARRPSSRARAKASSSASISSTT
eukprot:scaffold85341_cov44-Phaeocystis_antarctica.AAC.1